MDKVTNGIITNTTCKKKSYSIFKKKRILWCLITSLVIICLVLFGIFLWWNKKISLKQIDIKKDEHPIPPVIYEESQKPEDEIEIDKNDMIKMNKILIATTQSILSGEEIDTGIADELTKLYSSQLTITANMYSIVKFIKNSSNNAIDLSDKLEDIPVEIDDD